MFASWKKAGLAVAVAVTASGLLAAPSAEALEGIQGRHAIFYPSLELIYQHDDNFFLSQTDESDADIWMARANFRLEIPGGRQYLSLRYSPMFREVDAQGSDGSDYDIPDSVTHDWELDAHLTGSSVFSVDVAHDFALGNMQTFRIDPSGDPLVGQELFASDARFWANDIELDFNWEGSRQGATLSLGHHLTEFDDLQEAPAWFELERIDLGVEYFYKFTPLTRFNVGLRHGTGTADYTPKLEAERIDGNGNPLLENDFDETEIFFGFGGELGRTTTGHAELSLASFELEEQFFVADQLSDTEWDGINLRATVTKAFSRWSKLAFFGAREVNISSFDANSYYVSNVATLNFNNQPQGGRVGWMVGAGFHRNSYDQDVVLDSTGDIVGEREDDITYIRAEVGYHPLEHLSLRLNYRHEERDSNAENFNYDDNLWIFQVQFGF